MPIPARLQETLELLGLLPERQDRIDFLIGTSERFVPTTQPPPFPETRRVPGCESEAFVWVDTKEGGLQLDFAVLNPQGISAMALAVVLKDALDGEDVSAAAGVPDDLALLLFGKELSMGKSLGLMNTVRMVKSQAGALSSPGTTMP